METRQLGGLWPVSALTLGGGGIGQLWGETTREEAVATVRAAVDNGITFGEESTDQGDVWKYLMVNYAAGARLAYARISHAFSDCRI